MKNVAKAAVVFACAVLWMALLTKNSAAQSEYVGDVGAGLLVYEQRCANCHGAFGEGDGELAAQAINPPTPIGTASYLRTSVPTDMFEVITNGNVQAGMPLFGERSSNPLTEQQRWDVIAALYALGSDSAELPATIPTLSSDWRTVSNEAISEQLISSGVAPNDADAAAFGWRLAQTRYQFDNVTVSGQVINATTGEPVANSAVDVVAFEKFAVADLFSAVTNEQGVFELNEPLVADWIMRAEVAYNGIEYASDFFLPHQLDQADSQTLFANIDVFASSDDASGMVLNQLHTVVNVTDNFAIVTQLYNLGNLGNTVYTGGVPISLPEGAQSANFNVLSGGQIFPADSVEQTPTGWRDTQPIAPSSEALTLLVRYGLPATEAVRVAHALTLSTANASLVLPAEYELNVEDGWLFESSEQIEGRQFVTYVGELGSGVFSAEMVRTNQFAFDADGNRIKLRDQGQELIVGVISLGLVLLSSAYLIHQWQNATPADPTALLQEIAALDDAFAAKEIKKKPYETRRKALIQQLKDIWAAQ